MGLLDQFSALPAEQQQAINSGLLSMAGALLTPQWKGGGMGAAFQAFPAAIDRAQQQSRQNKMLTLQEQQLGLQTDEAKRKAEAQARQQAALAKLLSDPAFANNPAAAALLGIGQADKAVERAYPAPQKPTFQTWYENGQQRSGFVAPGQAPQPVGEAKPPDMNQYLIPDGKGGWMPNQAFINAKQSVAAAGAGRNSVTMVQEPAEAKKVGEYYGTQFADIQKAGLDAAGKVNRLDRMQQLLSGLETGKLTPAMTEVKSTLEALGIPVDKNLGNAQAAQALSNELALQMRNPSGGAGMPGAMSDADRNFLQQTVPSLSKTPEGNRMMIETAKRLAKRDQEVAKLARDYRGKHGHLDEGFFNELQAYSEKNQMFSDMGTPKTQGFSIRKLP